MDISAEKYIDSFIGPIKFSALNAILYLTTGFIRGAINIFLSNGISIKFILGFLKLGWIELDKSQLEPHDGYFLFCITPKFNLDSAADEIISNLDGGLKSMLGRGQDGLVIEKETLYNLHERFGENLEKSDFYSEGEKRTI